MASLSQIPSDDFNYRDVNIRRISEDDLISVSDLWKAEGKPWSVRPDLWAKQEENRKFIEKTALRLGTPSWKVQRGGSIALQGTFASPEVAVRYAASLSIECCDWLCEVLDVRVSGVKAERRDIKLGVILLEVFRLPSGEYRLSQTQVAEAIGKDESYFRKFLGSKSPEALPYKDFNSGKLAVEDSKAPINPIPIDLAIAFWTKEAWSLNPQAIQLLAASAKEAIERRADRAFGVHRSEEEYNRRFSAFDILSTVFPEYAQFDDPVSSADSMTFTEVESDILKRLKKKFPSEIFSPPKKALIRDLLLLCAETDDWHLTRERAFSYPEGAANRNAYPDLVSKPFDYIVDGKPQKIVLLLQFAQSIVDENHVKECFYLREYIDLVKNHYQADLGLLFFVSPYGVTQYAAGCIKQRDELRSCVGVITVKQLAKFLLVKALQNKGDNIRAGRLKKDFKHLVSYKDLQELLDQENSHQIIEQAEAFPEIQLDLFSA